VRAAAANDGPQHSVVCRHRHITVAVGPPNGDSELAEHAQQHGRGVPVVVVQADTDHRDPRVDRGEEGGEGVGRAVVRNLEHVRAQVLTSVEHRLLRLHLGVPREQDALARDVGPQDDRRVVRVRMGSPEARGRAEDRQGVGA
jgi:hypothetical protein